MIYNTLLFVLSLSHMSVHIVMMLVPSMFIDLVEFYGLTKASLGLIFSISSFCFGLGSLPMSLLYNKYGPRMLLVLSQLGIFASAFLASNCQSVESFAVFNIFLGLFASIHHPVSLTLISEVFDNNISKANAFHGIFGSLGVSIGPLLCYYAVNNFDWQFSFFMIAIFNLIIAPITYFVIPKSKSRESISTLDFKKGSQLRMLKIFCFLSLVVGIVFTVFNTFIPSVFKVALGEKSNLLVSGILIFGIIGQILSGFFGDKYNRMKLLSFVLMILCPLFFATYFLSNFSLVTVSVLLAIFMYAIQPLINSIIKDITNPRIRPLVFGMNFFLMFGVSGLVAALGGLIADLDSFKLIFPIFSILFPVGIFLLYLLNKNKEVVEV
ncbi:MFS transporter [Candidatus Marinimicrobia bacterium]|nr:MFS transporter [Candidatus Neomarinimicrobiota bacterium]MDC1146028.1 MFS transporter [Candidatus Neomarinimicrobiota bacterium]MDC3287392.1 MFS transporter [Candidatus Neomarinimicrobiota bacterium]